MGMITDSIESIESKKNKLDNARKGSEEIDDNYFEDDYQKEVDLARNRKRAKLVEVE